MVDKEKLVIDYINENLDDDDFYCTDTMPNPRPSDKMILVESAGGSSSFSEALDASTIAIQTYAPTRAEAYKLAGKVHDIIPFMADEVDEVAYVSQDDIINRTDREPRYQLVIYMKVVNYY